MTSEADPSAAASAALEELRSLVGELARIDAAVAAAQWDDGSALAGVVAEARSQLKSAELAVSGDIAAAGASEHWQARAQGYLRDADRTGAPSPPARADADAVVAVGLARVAVAEAILAVAEANRLTGSGSRGRTGDGPCSAGSARCWAISATGSVTRSGMSGPASHGRS